MLCPGEAAGVPGLEDGRRLYSLPGLRGGLFEVRPDALRLLAGLGGQPGDNLLGT
jgi:hypothetical protein